MRENSKSGFRISTDKKNQNLRNNKRLWKSSEINLFKERKSRETKKWKSDATKSTQLTRRSLHVLFLFGLAIWFETLILFALISTKFYSHSFDGWAMAFAIQSSFQGFFNIYLIFKSKFIIIKKISEIKDNHRINSWKLYFKNEIIFNTKNKSAWLKWNKNKWK